MAKDKKKTSENAEASAVEETKSTKKAKTELTKAEKSKPEKSSKKEAKKADKKDGEKKNIFKSIGKWFHDLRVEFKNVTWPSRDTVVINTSVVVFVVVAGSVIIGLLDSGLLKLMQFLISLSAK